MDVNQLHRFVFKYSIPGFHFSYQKDHNLIYLLSELEMEKQQLMFYKAVYLTDLTKICIDTAAISGNIISSVLYLGDLFSFQKVQTLLSLRYLENCNEKKYFPLYIKRLRSYRSSKYQFYYSLGQKLISVVCTVCFVNYFKSILCCSILNQLRTF